MQAWPTLAPQTVSVDEDLKSLGIGKGDPKLLDTAIRLWESGGYYYLIDSDTPVEGNDYSKKRKLTAYNAIAPGVTSDDNPVSVAVGAVPMDNGNKELVVRFRIHPGYHIYGYVSEMDPYIKTVIKLTLPAGYRKISPIEAPTATLYNPNRTTVYRDEATFVQEIAGSGRGEVRCEVIYQTCNASMCHPPVEAQFRINI